MVKLQVSDAKEWGVGLRAVVSARNAPQTWDLRCEVREKLVAFLQREHPEALPTARVWYTAAGRDERHAGGRTKLSTGPDPDETSTKRASQTPSGITTD